MLNRRAGINRLPWNAAHIMDTKFETHRMQLIGEWFESLAAGAGGKAIIGWNQTAEGVPDD